MDKEMVCMLEQGRCEIIFAAWVNIFFLSSDFLMKCMTGFVSIILKILIQKTNTHVQINTEPLLPFLLSGNSSKRM